MIRDLNWFRNPRHVIGSLTGDRNHFVAAADGQRFLINNVVDDDNKQPITLVLNWAGGLKQ
ncbi:MAG TPA: hypothetical protein VGW76_08185 [Pyrinomonadaceae bacterium]|nr:hypothetical protein [Pyrinomonadaceae bacterium]